MESRGRNVELPQKIITYTNILFPAEKEFGVKNNLFTYQCLHERTREREPGYMKKRERWYY